ncbi:MAG TPA: hypothetical protein PKN52_00025 [Trueperaceae bacterium]|nr:hypothetical protein [Trueperaceae bacterium]
MSTENRVVEMPRSDHLRPEQALAEASKTDWDEVIVIGIDKSGAFDMVNSEISLERALFLLEWARRYCWSSTEE